MSINLDILSIKGTHNVYNSMAAALSASVMNIKKKIFVILYRILKA